MNKIVDAKELELALELLTRFDAGNRAGLLVGVSESVCDVFSWLIQGCWIFVDKEGKVLYPLGTK